MPYKSASRSLTMTKSAATIVFAGRFSRSSSANVASVSATLDSTTRVSQKYSGNSSLSGIVS